MSKKIIFGLWFGVLALFASIFIPLLVSGSSHTSMDTWVQTVIAKQIPQPPAKAFAYSIFRTAPLEVAKVFGRTQGCADADAELIESTARAAIDAGLDPAILAATIGVESGCNPFAISGRGAVGLTQVVPHIWKETYNFELTYNLLNPKDNLHVGAAILSNLINQYGVLNGLHRYNGLGQDCPSCDAGYADKITRLVGR
jgi:hypothetical protein